jgi:HSP20 family protein
MLRIKSDRNFKNRSPFPSQFFDEFFDNNWPWTDFDSSMDRNADWVPAANVKETASTYHIELSVPGYTRDDITVELGDNNVLSIRGERRDELEEKEGDFSRKEFKYGSFSRSFKLPSAVNDGEISATVKKGIITIDIPKAKLEEPEKAIKNIEIS